MHQPWLHQLCAAKQSLNSIFRFARECGQDNNIITFQKISAIPLVVKFAEISDACFTMSQAPLYIDKQTVCEVLTWPMALEATKQALSAVSNNNASENSLPHADQPARSFTWTTGKAGVLLSMPGYAGNYSDGERKCDAFGCKLVTSFPENPQRSDHLPNILANIMLLESTTGRLKCVMEATDITAWRTAAASLNATKYLYYQREETTADENKVLAIIGCGVEGRFHSIGMCSVFKISEVRLWNRNKSKAETLKTELENIRKSFKYSEINVVVCDTPKECASSADIIVTATFAESPVLFFGDIKDNVHINAIGAGITHYSELDPKIYSNAQVYVDHMKGEKSELKGLPSLIIGEVGEGINGLKKPPRNGPTIFQSMGMACEDIILAEAIFEIVKDRKRSTMITV